MLLEKASGTLGCTDPEGPYTLRLMDKILHDPKDPKLWELWYIPYYGSCRILSINRTIMELGTKLGGPFDLISRVSKVGHGGL